MAKNGNGGYTKLDMAPKGARLNSRVETQQRNGQIVNPPRYLKDFDNRSGGPKKKNAQNVERPGREK